MPKARMPVSINGIEFDALIAQSHTLDATVPQYSTEDGFSVSDSIILNPERLSMTLYVTDTPVTWAKRHGSYRGRTEQICRQLEELYYSSQTVTIITTEQTFTDMAIESLTIAKSEETGYSREIPINFVRIRKTAAKTTTIPASYGKSGATGASAGSANTKAGSANTKAGSTDSNGSNGKKSSILKGIKDSATAYLQIGKTVLNSKGAR